MENKTKKNILVNYTVIAAIIALLFPLAGLFFEFITNNEMDYTLSGIFSIYKDNPAQIILLSFIIIIPLSVFIYIFYFTDRFFNIEEQISKEKSRKKELTSFTQKLMNNDFDADLTLYEDNDLLKRALIDLRDTLKDNTEKEQKRRLKMKKADG